MASKNELYLEGYISDKNNDRIQMSIETYISVFALLSSENCSLKLCFVNLNNSLPFSSSQKLFTTFCVRFLSKDSFLQQKLHCSLPLVSLGCKKTVVGGLCAVLRWTVKDLLEKMPNHPSKSLLGFRGGCLVSCSENSIWTKLCELEFPQAVKGVFESPTHEINYICIPECLIKLETHLKVPVRTHNILKRTQDMVKKLKKDSDSEVKSADNNVVEDAFGQNGEMFISKTCQLFNKMELTDDLQLVHSYLEGIDFTLTDVIVLPCVYFLFEHLTIKDIGFLHNVRRWYKRILSISCVEKAVRAFEWAPINNNTFYKLPEDCHQALLPLANEGSLYSRDTNNLKVRCRNFDPLPVVSLLKDNNVIPIYEKNCLPRLNWDQLPAVLHPSYGDLPKKRIQRKCQQLENIVAAVCRIALAGQVVVDFCSGGGHVGLLLAYNLPNCEIILVENKEESLLRARKRASISNLKNIKFFQCNLDYFTATFDIGVSLHACGVATDLVINKCIAENAAFVCCPCCYGAIQETDLLKYPLSQTFSNHITYKDFAMLAHCADRTERNTARTQQGIYCMGLVDTDRLLHATECGYTVELSKMEPATCSPKHNLLIGTKCS